MLRKMSNDVVVPGIYVTCPICKQLLSKSEQGVGSHLKRHVRKNELSKDEEVATKNRIIGRTFDEELKRSQPCQQKKH